MSALTELIRIGDRRWAGGSGDDTDARDGSEPLACFVLGVPEAQLLVENRDFVRQFSYPADQNVERPMRGRRQGLISEGLIGSPSGYGP